MRADIYPIQLLILSVSGWVNREQQRVLEYLIEERGIPHRGADVAVSVSVVPVSVPPGGVALVQRPRYTSA